MASYAQLIPLIILIPAIGAFINMFLGPKLGEKISGYVGIGAALLSFAVAVLIFSYVNGAHGAGDVINAPIVDGWIRIESIGLDIPWQFRVDSLSSVMMLVVTGIGSLIHIYAYGYMHGDPKFSRFFVFLNMFFVFMLLLVTANNYVMMFVGWEGVGLCSYLLIGFWWDKKHPTGWRNANAARKAVIVNRIGDFGLVISMFLIFWTFGTFDYYRPGEIANVEFTKKFHGYAASGYGAEAGSEAAVTTESGTPSEGDAHADEGYGDKGHSAPPLNEIDNSLFRTDQLGVFGQTIRLSELPVGSPERMISFGPFTLEFGQVMFLIVFFMLIGVTAKSAQIPLFVWLPDAMAGPTPVSALMHAATMVTAGVFLLIRSNVLLEAAPEVKAIIAVVGALTALMGGFIGLGQWDIKRVLAYSTVSQLGFMVAAIGLGAYVPAMFHLVTHAIFKACLFLGSGSVIHGVEHGHHHAHAHGHGHDAHGHDDHGHDAHGHEHEEEFDPQDMRNMGGLWKRMPITFWTYLFATFALAGLFPFAGFWSKDEILADAWNVGFVKGNPIGFIVLGLLIVAAGFTAFYMWRQVQMIFFGEPRTEAAANAPESVAWMTIPLVLLAAGSLVGGFINMPEPINGIFKPHEFGHLIEQAIPSVTANGYLKFNLLLAGIATIVAVGAIFVAHSIYAGSKAVRGGGPAAERRDPLEYTPSSQPIFALANARLYWDEIYYRLIENPFNRLGALLYDLDWKLLHDYFHDTVLYKGYKNMGTLLARGVDLGVIDAVVLGVGRLTRSASSRLRVVQTGYVRTYAVALLLGVVAVVIVMVLPLLQNA
jgi:NADH:ubiquinone oxidoreductase subunit 5 (subunit L)/multisubunit Na+/H+ antiporter MnhA subunit